MSVTWRKRIPAAVIAAALAAPGPAPAQAPGPDAPDPAPARPGPMRRVPPRPHSPRPEPDLPGPRGAVLPFLDPEAVVTVTGTITGDDKIGYTLTGRIDPTAPVRKFLLVLPVGDRVQSPLSPLAVGSRALVSGYLGRRGEDTFLFVTNAMLPLSDDAGAARPGAAVR